MSVNKKLITDTIYGELLKKDHASKFPENIEHYLKDWWVTPSFSNTLRLSDSGRFAFELLEIENYSFPFRFGIQNDHFNQMSFLKFLGKAIRCPYYVCKHNIVEVFDSKIALKISLYDDILSYYASYLKIKKR